MAFDFFFVVAQSSEEASQLVRQARHGARPASHAQEVRMRRLVVRLLEVSPKAVVRPYAGGFAHGVWVGEGRFPDLEIGPQSVFCSFHPVLGPQADRHMRELIALFEELGYMAFDPQAGRVVTSGNFSFAQAPSAQSRCTQKPWWKFWQGRWRAATR